MESFFQPNRGVALYLTVMISSLIFIMALNLASIFFTQTKLVSGLGYSVSAFYAAETGIEKALFDIGQGSLQTEWSGSLENGATYLTTKLSPGQADCSALAENYCLKSLGTYKETKRGIRLTR
jgi:hypothetical protein